MKIWTDLFDSMTFLQSDIWKHLTSQKMQEEDCDIDLDILHPWFVGTQLTNSLLYAPSSSIRGHRAESIMTNSAEGDRDSSTSSD